MFLARVMALGACTLMGLSVAPAFAADDASQATLDEVVVTATKRETSLEKTPVSITVLSADTLKDDRIATITDLGSVTPGVVINGRAQGAGNPITIRGIGSDVLGLGADDAVAVYLDGVYQGRQYGAVSELPGVDRIEVLRGPQGTLYGRNATGGAISVVSKEPSTVSAVSFDAGYGSLNERSAAFFGTTGVFNDAAAVSLAAAYRQRDGYSHNAYTGTDLNDEENWTVNGAFSLLDVEGLHAVLRGDVGVLRSSFQSKAIPDGDGNPDSYDVNFPGREDRRFGGIGLTLDYDLGFATATSITATRRAAYHGTFDSDGTAADLFRIDPYFEDQHQFSEEIRLASKRDKPFQWLIGGYYFDEHASGTLDIPFIIYASDISLISSNQTHSYAAFGESSYQVTDKLKATVGLRYSIDHKAFDFDQEATGIFPTVPLSHSNNDASATTPRFVLEYQATPDVMVYGSASKGFKSGGFSALNPLPFGSPRPFFPEYVWAYEGGIKSELLDHRLRWNNTVFYYNYTNLQVRTSDQYGFVVIQNAASAHIKGAETELELKPSRDWNLGVNLAYLDARYTQFVSDVPGLTVVDDSGKTLNRAPRWSTDAWAQYTYTLGASGSLTLRGQYSYKTTVYYTTDNVQPYGTGPEGEAKARLTYAAPGNGWSVSLYGDNLTDRRYRTSVFDVVGVPQALYNLPRTYGVEFHISR